MSRRQARGGASTPAEPSFDDTAGLYIRDAANVVGVTRAVMRDWERQGLLSPHRGANGYRLYTHEDIERAKQIRRLIHRDRLNAAGVRSVLGVPKAPASGQRGPNGRDKSDSDEWAGFGRHIRRLRREKGLSLRALSAMTGLGPSHISAIERSLTHPSMASLTTLAEALGSNTLRLLGNDIPSEDDVVRSDERPLSHLKFTGMKIERLDRHGLDLSAHLMTVLPGHGSDGTYKHGGEEFILVLTGEFEITLDETRTHLLGPMDAVTFSSLRPHRWRNPGTNPAVIVWIDTPAIAL
jgi:DNA-binding transcriptional MerR regulator/quercetin dioxygenase-like cupin family protein